MIEIISIILSFFFSDRVFCDWYDTPIVYKDSRKRSLSAQYTLLGNKFQEAKSLRRSTLNGRSHSKYVILYLYNILIRINIFINYNILINYNIKEKFGRHFEIEKLSRNLRNSEKTRIIKKDEISRWTVHHSQKGDGLSITDIFL